MYDPVRGRKSFLVGWVDLVTDLEMYDPVRGRNTFSQLTDAGSPEVCKNIGKGQVTAFRKDTEFEDEDVIIL